MAVESSRTLKLVGAAIGGVVLLAALYLMFSSGSLLLIALAGIALVGTCVWLLLMVYRWHDRRVALRTSDVSSEIDKDDPMARVMELHRSFNKGMQCFSSFEKGVYSLPWYMVVGEKDAGKTEAIRHSGFGFPPGLHDELEGIGGDGTLNWWFTNQAVLLDTVGEWFSEDEPSEGSAPGEWSELCKLLALHRPRSPINGLVLALSAEDLLRDSEEETKEKAAKLSRKLAQAQQLLEVRFPINVVITKCDKVVGFREFFRELLPEERQQILGWSNPAPLEEAYNPNDIREHLGGLFDTLEQRRLELLSPRLAAWGGFEAGRADAILGFPGNLSRLIPKLHSYLEAIFLLGEWSTTPLFLRGVYFTSSVQEGSVLDLDAREAFGLPAEVALKEDDDEEVETKEDHSYFLHDLFADKVAEEKGLVLDAGSARVSRRIRQGLVWAFGLAGVSLLIFLTWFSANALQDELGKELGYWEAAAGDSQWEEFRGRWAWRPVIKPASGRDDQFVYTGTDTFDVQDGRFTTGDFLGEIAGRAEKPISLPWIFSFSARMGGDLDKRRLAAARTLFESSVLRPLVAAVVDRMVIQSADDWGPKATDALEQLIRLMISAGGRDPGSEDKSPVDLDALFGYALADAPADYDRCAREHLEIYQDALGKLYAERDAGTWPPASLEIGEEKTRQALEKGVASFKTYWADQITARRTSQFLGELSSLAEAGEDFLKSEGGLARLVGGAVGTELPTGLVGHNMASGEWERHFAGLSAASKVISRGERLLKSGTLQEAHERARALALVEAEKAFKKVRDINAVSRGGGVTSEPFKLIGELDDSLKAGLEELKALSQSGGSADRMAKLDSRVFAPVGEQAFASSTARAYRHRFETYSLAYEQLVARTEADGVFGLAKDLKAARAAITRCRARVRERLGPPGEIPLAVEAVRASLFACDLAERGRQFLLLKSALDSIQGASGSRRPALIPGEPGPSVKGRLEAFVRDRAKAKGFAAALRPTVPLTQAAGDDAHRFDQRYNSEAAAELLAGWGAIRSALGTTGAGDPKPDDSDPPIELDELKKEHALHKPIVETYFVSYLTYWVNTVDRGLMVRLAAGGDLFGDLTKVVPWKVNKSIGDLTKVAHRALTGFDSAADPVLGARVKSIRTGIEAGRGTISEEAFLARCADIVLRWSEARDDPDGVRRTILSSKPAAFLQAYMASGGVAEQDVVLRYWQSLTSQALEQLAGDFQTKAGRELARLKTLKAFPLAGPTEKVLGMDQIADAHRVFDRLRIDPRGLPEGTLGHAGKTGVPELDDTLARLATFKLQGASRKWFLAADEVLSGLPRTEPLECEVLLLSVDDQKALLDKVGLEYGTTSAARIWRSIALFQGSRARSKMAKTEQTEEISLGKVVYPGKALRLNLHMFPDTPAARTIEAAGPWGCILLLHEYGAKRSEKNGREWHVGVKLKDDVGRRRVLWLKLVFSRDLPALEDWPSSTGVDLTVTKPVGDEPTVAGAERAARAEQFRQWMSKGAAHKLAGKFKEAADAYDRAASFESAGSTKASEEARRCRLELKPPAVGPEDGAPRKPEGEAGKLATAVAAILDAGRHREAWSLVSDARKRGLDSPRLQALARQIVGKLSPKPTLKGPLGTEFVLVRGGSLDMGREGGETDERPIHRVTLSGFYVGRLEVTRAQYEAFKKKLTDAPAGISNGRQPMVTVSWKEAVAFCEYLGKVDPAKAVYRLPTEAEWEFAARGGKGRMYPWGNEPVGVTHANIAGGADGHAGLAPVGSFPAGATPEGILDMFGNAGEWCRDWFGRYSPEDQTDPTGARRGDQRIVRGSSFAYSTKEWPAATTRGCAPPDGKLDTIGFRVVRELSSEEKEFERLARDE